MPSGFPQLFDSKPLGALAVEPACADLDVRSAVVAGGAEVDPEPLGQRHQETLTLL
jgi:hypothetical protein